MSGLFEHFAAFDDSHIVAGRKAAAVTKKRLTTHFAGFLASAQDADEYAARHTLISSEINAIIHQAADEFGLEGETREHFIASLSDEMKTAAGGFCDDCRKWKSGPRAGCTCGDDDTAVEDDAMEHEASDEIPEIQKHALTPPVNMGMDTGLQQPPHGPPPAVGPHPNLNMMDGINSPTGPHPGPGPQQPPPVPPIPGAQQIMQNPPQPNLGVGNLMYGGSESYRPPFPVDENGEGITDIEQELAHAPSAVGVGEKDSRVAAPRVDTGDSAEKREKVTQEPGPSPKMDKKRWKPNALNPDGNLPVIKTEGPGSPHPTTHQDAPGKADWASDDFLRDTQPNNEQQDLPTADDQGQTTDRNIKQYPTQTFTDAHGTTNPVTHEVMAANQPNQATNPLRELLESEFDGFLPSSTVQSAIQEFENGDPS